MSLPYALGKQKYSNGTIDLTADDIAVVLCKVGYVPDLAADEFLNDISGGDQIARSPNLSGQQILAGGVFDADDVTLPAVGAGDTITQMVIVQWTGSAATSALLWWVDQIAGVPLVTDGDDIDVSWSPNGIAVV